MTSRTQVARVQTLWLGLANEIHPAPFIYSWSLTEIQPCPFVSVWSTTESTQRGAHNRDLLSIKLNFHYLALFRKSADLILDNRLHTLPTQFNPSRTLPNPDCPHPDREKGGKKKRKILFKYNPTDEIKSKPISLWILLFSEIAKMSTSRKIINKKNQQSASQIFN